MTAEQIVDFNYNFNMYCERLSPVTKIMPWVDAVTTYGTEYYVPAKPQRPTTGKAFSTEAQREIQYVELTSPTVAIWMDMEIPDVDRRILSRTTGMNIENSWAQIAAQQMMQQVAHGIYMGDTKTEMAGLFAKAGMTSTYNTVKWNAATGPHLTINDMVYGSSAKLFTTGFRPPYVCILSDNLILGLVTTINAAPVTDTTNQDVMLNLLNGNKSGDTSNLHFERIGTNATDGKEIYPIETATSNNGRAIVMKPVQDGQTFVRGVWCQRPHTTDWDFDAKTDRWHTRIKAMFTLEVIEENGYCIAGHTSVDFA